MALLVSTKPPQHFDVFSEDDEETWKILVSLKDGDADISPLLDGLARRLQEDWCSGTIKPDCVWGNGERYWKDLVSDFSQRTTFIYSDAESQRLDAHSQLAPSTENIPAAFHTDAGKKHTAATAALLGLSEERAVQITLGALRSMDVTAPLSNSNNIESKLSDFSSLLGTRDLLLRCMMYHYQQRLARLSVLAECMRLEEDPETLQHSAIVAFLDSLDSTFSQTVIIDNERKTLSRGIFKSLLITGCQSDPRPNLASLEPSKKLLNPFEQWGENAFETFAATIIAENKRQAARERTQAMEGILALLYGERMQGGMMRSDYGLLISAAFDFNKGTNRTFLDSRWNDLLGLICIESMSLWKAMERAADNTGMLLQSGGSDQPSAHTHPMFLYLDSAVGMAEMESLINLFRQLLDMKSSPSTTWLQEKERPESVAALSFGLLLLFAQDCSPTQYELQVGDKPIRTFGTDLVRVATDKGGAFEYLATSISHLSGSTLARYPTVVKCDTLYDWQLSATTDDGGDQIMSASINETSPDHSLAADVVSYTSIAQELVGATISLYRGSILAIDREDSWQKIGMMSNLFATIATNNTVLCDQFWDSWDSYLPTRSAQIDNRRPSKFPLCQLFDASFDLALLALKAIPSNEITSHSFVKSVAPFIRMFSTLCYTPDLVEKCLNDSISILLQTALLCCSDPLSTSIAAPDDELHRRLVIIESFAKLARVGRKTKLCTELLRNILEEEYLVPSSPGSGSRHARGSGLLAGILLQDQVDDRTTCAILQIVSHLLNFAPVGWVIAVASQFLSEDAPLNLKLNSLIVSDNEEVAHSVVLVLAGLIRHFDAFCFEKLLSPEDSVSYIQAIGSCLKAALIILAALTTTEQPQKRSDASGATLNQCAAISLETVESILQSCADFLKWTRPLVKGQADTVRGVTLVRDSLIKLLASNDVCTGIVYYAIAPVSHTIALRMEEEMSDARILDRVSRGGDAENIEKYGAWAFLSSSKNRMDMNESLVKTKTLEFLSTMSMSDIDFAATRARGWSNEGDDKGQLSLNASWSAIRLLSEWASHVEDIALTYQEDVPFLKSTPSEEAVTIIRELSPQRILCSSAPIPFPCRKNPGLLVLWQQLGLSTFDLLLPFLSPEDLHTEGGQNDSWMPTSILLDFVHACIVQSTFLGIRDAVEDLPLVRGLTESHHLVHLLTGLLKHGLEFAEGGNATSDISEREREALLCVFLSLRILKACANLDSATSVSIFDASLLDVLVQTSSIAQTILEVGEYNQIFSSESNVLQMRLASASMDVLASITDAATLNTDSNKESDRWALVSKYGDSDAPFVTQLLNIIYNYANTVGGSASEMSRESDHGRVSIMLFLASALKFIKTVVKVDSEREDKNSISSKILEQILHSSNFLLLRDFSPFAQSRKFFDDTIKGAGLETDSIDAMLSFRTTSSSALLKDYYETENSFDQRSLCHWFAGIRTQMHKNCRVTLEQVLDELSRCHSLIASELALIESWSDLSKIMAYDIFSRNEFSLPSSNAECLMRHSEDTLKSLKDNLQVASECASEGYVMNDVVVAMSTFLGDLLQFLLELGGFDGIPLDKLIACLGQLTDVMDDLSNIFFPLLQVGCKRVTEIYCHLQQNLLGSCLIIVGLTESKNQVDQSHSIQRDINVKLCLATCRFVHNFCVCNEKKDSFSAGDFETIRLCSALLTHVVLNGGQTDSVTIAGSLTEYEAPKKLMTYASRFSLSITSTENMTGTRKRFEGKTGDRNPHDAIKAVFDFLLAVTAVLDWELLETLPEFELSHLLVRNPLFEARLPLWCPEGTITSPPRGYVFEGEMTMIPSQKATLLVGTNDPIFFIWLTAMRILSSITRTCSLQERVGKSSSALSVMSIEFLRIYRCPLLASLKSCGDKLTKNSVNEATVLLEMVTVLYCSHSREMSETSYKIIFDEFLDSAKFIVSTLSKFLGATGNSQELFMAINEHESTEEDGFEQRTHSPRVFAHSRLLSEGLSSIKHEAIKFSHYTSGRAGRITREDFEASALVPHHLKEFSVDHSHDNDLERNCRLAVTSNFSLQLVREASACLSQALSLIWSTHSSNCSFYFIPGYSRGEHDLLRLVQPGLVVGYRQNVGASLLENVLSFSSLRFGIVLTVNTFDSIWEVENIQQEGFRATTPNAKEKIRPEQLVGIEDKSARKPSSNLTEAPDDMAAFEVLSTSLSTANYIMILRWCHQQHIFGKSRSLTNGFEVPCAEQQIAEKAAILLGADLVLHDLNGNFDGWSKEKKAQLNAQIFELFADSEILDSNAENDSSSIPLKDGRMKNLLSCQVWTSMQQQVRPFVQQAWSEKLEADRLQKELKGAKRLGRRSGYRLR